MDQHERDQRAARAGVMVADLEARGVAAIAMTYVDTSGITRVKAVPPARLPHAAAWGIGMSPVFDAFLLDDSIVSGRYAGGPVGDLRLHPDLDRLVVLSAPAGWAWAPADRYDQDGEPHPQDSRALARREVQRLAGRGLRALAAFEVEWVISQGDGDDFVPACQGPAYGMTRITEQAAYLRDLLVALAEHEITVVQVHPEYAPGQYELSVAPEDPVGAADTLVLVRETIRAVSRAHGLRASFSPKVLAGGVGNGGHIHLSLWRDDANVMAAGDGPYGMGREGEAFAAGILARLPALLAVGAPSVASYLRLVPSHWAGAYVCWGLENREAGLRFVRGAAGERDRAANLEIKSFDPAANPYLVVAALLAAGQAGLDEDGTLPKPVEADPAGLDGIARLPAGLAEALAAFEAEPALKQALGEAVADTIGVVRRGEIALFDGASEEEIAARTRWRH